MEQEQESYRSRLFRFRGFNTDNNKDKDGGKHAKSLSVDSANKLDGASAGTPAAADDNNIDAKNQKNNNVPKSRFSRDETAEAAAEAAKAAAEAIDKLQHG